MMERVGNEKIRIIDRIVDSIRDPYLHEDENDNEIAREVKRATIHDVIFAICKIVSCISTILMWFPMMQNLFSVDFDYKFGLAYCLSGLAFLISSFQLEGNLLPPAIGEMMKSGECDCAVE